MGKLLGFYIMPHPPIVIPDVGKGEEVKIESTSNACLKISKEISELNPDTIIIITPHGPVFSDAIALMNIPKIKGDLIQFSAPQVSFNMNINIELTESIIENSNNVHLPALGLTENNSKNFGINLELDHGSMIPLYFINKNYKNYNLVHITYGILSEIDLYSFGMTIKKSVEESPFNAVVIASGDLSHKLSEDGPYGLSPYGKEFDNKITNLLQTGTVLDIFNLDKNKIESAAECGLESFYILLGTLDGTNYSGELLSYEGPFGVGYAVMNLKPINSECEGCIHKLKEIRDDKINKKRKNESMYVKLAREALEHYIKFGKFLDIQPYLSTELCEEKRGVFVSLKKFGTLRGCIGTIYPSTDNIASGIIRNSIEASSNDPRFLPVQESELPYLEYSVDILTTPEKTTKSELNPEKYGIIVSSKNRRGLLLPALEGIDTIDEQIAIALKKADISSSDTYSIERFEVVRYH